MEEQTGKIFVAVFLAVLLAGAILLYLIPIMQEEREEQQREEEELQKAAQEVMERRARQEEENKFEDIESSIKDIEIDVAKGSKYGGLWIHVDFLDSDGENINFDFSSFQLCYEVEIYNSAQKKEWGESPCISKNGTGTYISIHKRVGSLPLPEDGTLKVSYPVSYLASKYGRRNIIEKEIKIKDIPIPTPIPSPTPTPTVPGFEVVFAIGSLLAVAYLVLKRRG